MVSVVVYFWKQLFTINGSTKVLDVACETDGLLLRQGAARHQLGDHALCNFRGSTLCDGHDELFEFPGTFQPFQIRITTVSVFRREQVRQVLA